jgi:hypothetical protein
MIREDWIDDRNMFPVLTAIAWLCRYRFDKDDCAAFEAVLSKVDESKNIWFDYVFVGEGEIKVSVTIESGSSNYTIRVESELDIEQGVDMVISLAQEYEIKSF